MSLQRELQTELGAVLFADHPQERASLADAFGGDRGQYAQRLSIYRNNLREGFHKTLALEFPVIRRLVGEPYFRQLAPAFMAEHPSRCGDLYPIGAPLAAFLRTSHSQTRFDYLADVAALEWARQQVALAAYCAALDTSILRALPPEQLESIQFALNDACRLVHSAYPILRIWHMNQDEPAADETVDLDEGADHILARRVRNGIEMCRVSAATFALLESFAQGRPFGDSFDRARTADPAESGHTRLMLPDLWTGNRRPLLHRHFNQRPRMIP